MAVDQAFIIGPCVILLIDSVRVAARKRNQDVSDKMLGRH